MCYRCRIAPNHTAQTGKHESKWPPSTLDTKLPQRKNHKSQNRGAVPESRPQTTAVPQGSGPSPILFFLLMSDFPASTAGVLNLLFADDIAAICRAPDNVQSSALCNSDWTRLPAGQRNGGWPSQPPNPRRCRGCPVANVPRCLLAKETWPTQPHAETVHSAATKSEELQISR